MKAQQQKMDRRSRRRFFADAYQKQRETWGVNESAKRAAAELGVNVEELRIVIGLDRK